MSPRARHTASSLPSKAPGSSSACQRAATGPGLKAVRWASRLLDQLDVRRVAKPLLRRLRDDVGETVNLAILRDGSLVYVDILESPSPFRTADSGSAPSPPSMRPRSASRWRFTSSRPGWRRSSGRSRTATSPPRPPRPGPSSTSASTRPAATATRPTWRRSSRRRLRRRASAGPRRAHRRDQRVRTPRPDDRRADGAGWPRGARGGRGGRRTALMDRSRRLTPRGRRTARGDRSGTGPDPRPMAGRTRARCP